MTALFRTSGLAMIILLLTAGCATSPVATDRSEIAPLGPAHVLSGEARKGDRVVWGGKIVSIEHLPDRTELVIASYPLDRGDRPRLRAKAGVRFVLVEPDFLEPVDWAPGRFVTALGNVGGVEKRSTGEYRHPHPVLHAQRLHLWPADPARWTTQTSFNIGVGIRL
ncbi:Slp family lipoprotein [Wenzhouxiangella sp. AB-CW3]|uniref:Slp family lipoprotein n=1 Tax=Wenzhouxiangella sp. AB-CW3 TaxID=2771012 RepID=UPI00168BE972|nr:Slp family lipoprotein [Wenzhouxiangella sp. AB-CW3]QOC21126.1 Slp family lipoprotein [Wenzhouxiangella sp. AB-CW3]